MLRTFVTGVIAAVALLGAACGSEVGSDESSDTTAAPATTAAPSNDFVADLDAICADARAIGDTDEEEFEGALTSLQAAADSGFVAGDADYDRAIAEIVFVLETGVGHRQDAQDQIEALDAPADAEAALDDLITLNGEGIATLDELRVAFAADDGPAISALFDEAQATEASRDAQQQALADELGAPGCAPDQD